jgi:ComF family protein
MKRQIVNSTMLDQLISLIAPYYCISCDKIGRPLCDNCNYDIEYDPLMQCPRCHGMLVNSHCLRCRNAFTQLTTVAEYDGVLKRILHDYKYTPARGASAEIVSVMSRCLPYFPADSIVVPLVSSPDRVRARGFDHTTLVARQFAVARGYEYQNVLRRTKNIRQVGKTHAERLRQTKGLFACTAQLDSSRTYIVIDDIVTTSASLQAGAAALRRAGARTIIAAAVAHQHWS